MVLRATSEILNVVLQGVEADLCNIVLMVLTSTTKPDMERDHRTSNSYCTRLDFGIGGQNYQKQPDPKCPRRRHVPSDSVCGEHFFRAWEEKHGNSDVRRDIGRLMDALMDAMDQVHRQYRSRFPHLPFGCNQRNEQYSDHLRSFLMAKRMRFEWITIQLKCLTRG